MLKVAKATAANTDFVTAQSFFYTLGDSKLLALLISGVGEDIFSKIRYLRSNIEDEFQSSPLPASNLITSVIYQIKKNIEEIQHLQLVIVLIEGERIYLKSIGTHEVFLLRNNEVIALTDGIDPDLVVSGNWEPNDRILMISSPNIDLEDQTNLQQRADSVVDDFLKSPINDLNDTVEAFIATQSTPEPFAAILMGSKNRLTEEAIPSINEEKLRRTIDFKSKFAFFRPLIKKLIHLYPRNKKSYIISLIVLLTVIFSTIGFYTNYKKNESKRTLVASYLSLANQSFDKALQTKDSDTEQASQSLITAQDNLQRAIKLDPSNDQIANLKKKIDENKDNILKIRYINNPKIFLSLDLIKPNFSSSRMSSSLGKVLLLDDKQKSLVQIDLENKNPQILGGQQNLGNVLYTALNGELAFVYADDRGVSKIEVIYQKPSTVIKPDSEWGRIVDIVGFATNIYLLDVGKNQIWKYVPISSGYSDKFKYFEENTNLNLSSAKKFLIDSSVWVLTDQGLFKYTAGVEDNFSLSGLDQPIENINNFFVSDKTDSLYLLDKNNSRLVVLAKDGKYQTQYIGDIFKKVDDFIVQEADKKAYILSVGKIYGIDL